MFQRLNLKSANKADAVVEFVSKLFSILTKKYVEPKINEWQKKADLMNAVGFQFLKRSGMLLENAVYNELINSRYDEICFAQSKSECDFVARKEGVFHAFQVCHTLTP